MCMSHRFARRIRLFREHRTVSIDFQSIPDAKHASTPLIIWLCSLPLLSFFPELLHLSSSLPTPPLPPSLGRRRVEEGDGGKTQSLSSLLICSNSFYLLPPPAVNCAVGSDRMRLRASVAPKTIHITT
jgi:hypothetical protein